MTRIMRLFVFIIVLAMTASQAFCSNFPEPVSWTNDYAGALKDAQKKELDGILRNFEQTDSTQVFVCVMNKIPDGFTLESYVNELFAHWKIGQENKDNGALLAIFIQDRKMRLEVGYGLEHRLTDALSKIIIQNEITPAFKEGNYYLGINKGVKSIIRATKGAYKAAPGERKKKDSFIGGIVPFLRETVRLVRTEPLLGLLIAWLALLVIGTLYILFRMIWRFFKGVYQDLFSEGWTWGSVIVKILLLFWNLIKAIVIAIFTGWKTTSDSSEDSGWSSSFGSSSSLSSSSSSSSWSGGSSSSSSSFSGGGGGSSGGGGASGSW